MACDCFHNYNESIEKTHAARLNSSSGCCIIDVYHPGEVDNKSNLPTVVADFRSDAGLEPNGDCK